MIVPNVETTLTGKRVLFVGKLGGVTKRQAQQVVRDQGGLPVDRPSTDVDLVVIGAEELPLDEQGDLLDEATRQAADAGRLEIITETQFWQRLGLVDAEQHVRRLYTPAMLAELLAVPVAVIRRWHRRGLIVPAKEVHRLPYFDFQEIANARRLAQLLAAGVSPAAIEKKLAELARFVPDVERPLTQLSIIVEGKQLLLRQGEGLLEPSGQRRFNFDAAEQPDGPVSLEPTISLLAHEAAPGGLPSPADLLRRAAYLEDEGLLVQATDAYRAALAASGPSAETCFRLAELLYRQGDVTAARERYYMAIELDEDYVEARANLGCVLAETGDKELAVAAYNGALAFHQDYPDVHYHLARTLDELARPEEASTHWREFLRLAPNSPWAEEARERVGNEE